MMFKFALLVCVSLLSSPASVLGQSTFSELISRLSQEKAKVVSYRLTMHQTPDRGSTKFANCTWIIEKSNVGEHHVIALIKRNAKGEIRSWGVQGDSDQVSISGSSDNGKVVALDHELSGHRGVPLHLDWRLIGLGLCGDIGENFEAVCTNIANWDKDFPDGKGVEFNKTKSGIEVLQSDTRIEAEIADGFRILSFTSGKEPETIQQKSSYSQWVVQYQKQHGLILPKSATIKCGQESARIDCIWDMVNEPLSIGPKTAERFVEQLSKFKVRKDN